MDAEKLTTERLLEIIKTMHLACIEPDAHVGFKDEMWQTISDITGIKNPFYVNVPKAEQRKEFY